MTLGCRLRPLATLRHNDVVWVTKVKVSTAGSSDNAFSRSLVLIGRSARQ